MIELVWFISGGMFGFMFLILLKCEESVFSRALNDVMLIACVYVDNCNLLFFLFEFLEWLVEIFV